MTHQMWLHLQSDESVGSIGFKINYKGKKWACVCLCMWEKVHSFYVCEGAEKRFSKLLNKCRIFLVNFILKNDVFVDQGTSSIIPYNPAAIHCNLQNWFMWLLKEETTQCPAYKLNLNSWAVKHTFSSICSGILLLQPYLLWYNYRYIKES